MNTLRRLSAAIILSLTLAGSVFAGHMETPGAPAPPPAPVTSASTATSSADVINTILLMILEVTYR